MAAPLTLVLVLAVTIRAALFNSSLSKLIAERVEVISPVTSWKRGKRQFPAEGGGMSLQGGFTVQRLMLFNGLFIDQSQCTIRIYSVYIEKKKIFTFFIISNWPLMDMGSNDL